MTYKFVKTHVLTNKSMYRNIPLIWLLKSATDPYTLSWNWFESPIGCRDGTCMKLARECLLTCKHI